MNQDDDFDLGTEDPVSFLDELEAGLEDSEIAPAPVTPSMSRDEIEQLVDRTLEEELARLKQRHGPGGTGRP
jgi:hypothetical protein